MSEKIFKNRLLIGIVLPVLITGVLFSVVIIRFFLPPIIDGLRDRTDAMLKHASNMGISICEERQNSILELRLEDNLEMDIASKKEAIEQIRQISRMSPGIQVMVLEKDGTVIAGSFEVPVDRLDLGDYPRNPRDIISEKLGDIPVKLHYHYFPFWGWYVVSVIFEKDYMKPIQMARLTVLLGTFGVLSAVLAALVVMFIRRINRPLEAIIRATESVAKGNLKLLNVKGKDEISRVSTAFNAMVYSLIRDKEKISEAVRELQRSEEQYKVLTESSLTNIAMIRKDEFVFANRRMLESLHYESAEFMGMSFWTIIHSEDSGRVKQRIQGLKTGGPDMDHFECRVLSGNGEIFWFEMIAALVLYRDQDTVLIHAMDITVKKAEQQDRKKLEEKLSRAQKMEAIGALAGGVAHDLNNILSGIVGYPDLMLLDMAEDDPLRKPITEIQKSGKKAADIVQDMLTLARRGVAVTGSINMNDILSEYLTSPEYDTMMSFHRDVRVETRFEADLPNIKGSRVHLLKTIMNLVTNAAESMPDGGTILISIRNQYIDIPFGNYDTIIEGDYVAVSVSDTGIGISPEDLGKIFEPFYTKKVMGRSGTGLGMAVVWGTVKDHNGYIDMQSTVGKGTRFTLYFPVSRDVPAADEPVLTIEQYKGRGQTVLVVDDVAEQRDIASGMLEKLGYQVSTVSSGEAAVEHIKTHPADILVLDMIMDPGIDGLETYRRILDVSPGQKAVIASGFSETSRVKNAQRLGAGRYIRKPYTIERLGLAVRAELDREKNDDVS